MRKIIRSIPLITALTSLVAGCSLITTFDRSKIKRDGGGDVVRDAGPDATASSDAGPSTSDASSDAGHAARDAGRDAAVIVKHDAGHDAAVDDGGTSDAGVECNVPGDCAGTDSECQMRTCIANTCGVHNVGAGNALINAHQIAGDCKKIVCNGTGGTTTVNDDGDIAKDALDCTDDLCSNGTPTHPLLNVGTACSQNGGQSCDSTGNCVACLQASDCGTDTECVTFSCTGNVCGSTKVPVGTALANQTSGDCVQRECDTSGAVVSVALASDKPASDNNDCTTETCVGTTPTHQPTNAGSGCAQNGGTMCDGSGNCVGCVDASSCTGTDTFCHTRTCLSNSCGVSYTNVGLALPSANQITGDCLEVRCNSTGGTLDANLDSDLPADDGKECTVEACSSGTPQHNPVSAGTHCASDTKVCDAVGNCGGCLVASACGSSICIDQACATAGSLSAVSVTPASLVAGATGNVSIAFTTENKWPADGVLHVVFPAGFDASAASVVSLSATGSLSVTAASTLALTLTRSAGTQTTTAASISVVLGGIKNPSSAASTGNYTVATQTSAGVDIDSGTANGSTLTAAALSAVSVLPASLTAGATGNLSVAFTTENPWPANGVLQLVLPAGFDASAASFVSTSASGTLAVAVSGQTLTLTRSGGTSTAAGTSVSIVLGDIKNPPVSGSTGSYGVTTQTSTGVDIDTATAAGSAISAGTLSAPSVTPASSTTNATGNLTLAFTTQNPWPGNGVLQLVLPAGFDASAASFVSTSASGTLGVAVSGQTLTLTRSGASPTAAGASVSIVLGDIKNPASSGTTASYALATRTDAGANIDTGSAPGSTFIGTLSTASVNLTDTTHDAVTTATFSFVSESTWPKDGQLTLIFPAGFTLTALTLGTVAGVDGTLSVNVAGSTVTLTRDGTGTDLSSSAAVTIALDGVTNPTATGATGVFALATTTATGAVIDSAAAPPVTIN